MHTELTASETADRLALRELFDAYAHCADRRDAQGAEGALHRRHPVRGLHGRRGERADLRAGGTRVAHARFGDLNRYEATTHFNGQSTVTIDGHGATSESYTIAHHLFTEQGTRTIMIASLRYLDTFTKVGQSWCFAERNLILDWSETRSL